MATHSRNEALLLNGYARSDGSAVQRGFAVHTIRDSARTYAPRIMGGLTQAFSAYKGSGRRGATLGGRSEPSAVQVVLDNNDGGLADLADYCWHGQEATLYEIATRPGSIDGAQSSRTLCIEGEPKFKGRTVVIELKGLQRLQDEPLTSVYQAAPVALNFPDSTGHRIELPSECDVRVYPTWAVEFWCKPKAFARVSATNGIIGFVDGAAGQNMQLMAGSLASAAWDQSLAINMPSLFSASRDEPLTDSRWHWCAVVYNGNRLALLLDDRDAQEFNGAYFDPTAQTAGTVIVGAITTGGSRRYAGGVRQLRFWKAPPSYADLTSWRYRSEVEDPRLLCQYMLDEGAAIDVAGTRTDSHVFDSAVTPAGVGYGEVFGSPEWVPAPGQLDPNVRRQPRLVGDFRGVEPDAEDLRAHNYRLSDEPIAEVSELYAAGRRIKADQLLFAGPSDFVTFTMGSLTWLDGETRYMRVQCKPTDNSTHTLLSHSSGGVTIQLRLLSSGTLGSASSLDEKGGGNLMRVELQMDNGGGNPVTLTSQRGYLNNATLTIDIRAQSGGVVHLVVNGSREGSAALDSGTWTPTGTITVFGDLDGFGQGFEYGVAPIKPTLTDQALVEKQNVGEVDDATDVQIQWLFDEATGTTLTDQGSGGRNGTITGAAWTNTALVVRNTPAGCSIQSDAGAAGPLRVAGRGWMPLGHSVQVNDSSAVSRAEIPHDALHQMAGDWTYFVRFQYRTHPSFCYPFYKWATATVGSYLIQIYSTNLLRALVIDDTGTTHGTVGATTLEDGRWYWAHAVVQSGTNLELFIDGELEDDNTALGATNTPVITNDIWLGAGMNGGRVHHAGIVGRAMTQAEIYAHMGNPMEWAIENVADVAGYWPMWENEGTELFDMGPDAHLGDLTDGEWAEGYYPNTASEISRWLLLRGRRIRWDGFDEAALDDYERLAKSSTDDALVVGRYHNESPAEIIDDLVRPHGLWGFDPDGTVWMDYLLPPEVAEVPDLTGDSRLTLTGAWSNDSGPATIMAWVLNAFWNGSSDTVWVRQFDNHLFGINSSGELFCDWYDNNGVVTQVTAAAPEDLLRGERVRHVAISKEAVFLDGAEQATTVTVLPPVSYATGSTSVGWGTSTQSMIGFLREVQVIERNLSALEVESMRRFQRTGNESDLVFYLPLDEPYGTDPVERIGSITGSWSTSEPERRIANAGVYRAHDAILTRANSEEPTGQRVEPPYRLSSVKFSRNWDPYRPGELLESVVETPGFRTFLVDEWLEERVEAQPLICDLDQEREALTTPFVLRRVARRAGTVAALRYGVERQPFIVKTLEDVNLRMGKTVLLSQDRTDGARPWNGFPYGGRVFLLLGLKRNSYEQTTECLLWG